MGPFSGAFAGTKGDMKSRREIHKFCRHYGCNFMCDICGAAKHIRKLAYTNFKKSACWRRTQLSHASYMSQTTTKSGNKRTPWARHKGFHKSRMLLDWMHVGHMGVCRDFCGAFLFALCNDGHVEGDSLNDQLRLLWVEMRG